MMVGLESWQTCFGDDMHLAKVAISLIAELELTGGERRGRVSDDSTELTDTLAGSIALDMTSLCSTLTYSAGVMSVT